MDPEHKRQRSLSVSAADGAERGKDARRRTVATAGDGAPTAAASTVLTPEMALTPDHAALLAAINSSLGGRLDNIGKDVSAINTKLENHDSRLASLEARISTMRTEMDNMSRPASTVSTDDTSEHTSRLSHNPYATASAPTVTPVSQRTTIIMGGWPRDTGKTEIENDMKEILQGTAGITDYFCPGRRGSIEKINFNTSGDMWAFAKKSRGKKFTAGENTILLSMEKDETERLTAKRVTRGVALLRGSLQNKVAQHELDSYAEADWTRGIVWYKPQGAPVIRIFEKKKGETAFSVAETAGSAGIEGNLQDWLTDINNVSL
eukprot:TRINITY_DN39165_c0_g1_i1.p1 TRINITY_DN39165_c0_g1~~TRINITY_DN39165_c0_g1_i1.p1  ORF type:complete len:320 (+),score=51.86 TRINITY_DN39165_c0_g1_i1:22-981(+)